MGPETIWDKIKDWIGGIAWGVFLWSCQMTQEQYWEAIYQQEKQHKESGKICAATEDHCKDRAVPKGDYCRFHSDNLPF